MNGVMKTRGRNIKETGHFPMLEEPEAFNMLFKKALHAKNLATRVLPKEITERAIIVGDFNNNIGDAAINMLEMAGFRPTWTDLKIDVSNEFTYNAQIPKKNLGVIDHIFYSTSALNQPI